MARVKLCKPCLWTALIGIGILLFWYFKVLALGYYWVSTTLNAAHWKNASLWLPGYAVKVEGLAIEGLSRNASGLTFNTETGTLFTVINNRSGSGAHSGLMINGTERIMFDPAGTWNHPRIPERNDVHYGITPRMVDFYIDYHARETFRVVEQTVIVTPEVAEMVAAKAKAYGAVPKAQCARSVTSILSGVPGFESITSTWFPKKLMQDFATLPGVTERIIRDEDADKNHGVLLIQAANAPN